MDVQQIMELNKGEWYVTYLSPSLCGCSFSRDSIKIYQEDKPNTKQIEDAIRNKG